MLEREGLADVAVRRLGLTCRTPDLTQWAAMVRRAKHPEGQCAHRPGGQVCGPPRRIPVGGGGPHPRRHRERREREAPLGGLGGGHRRQRRRACWPGRTASWSPAGFGDRGIEGMICRRPVRPGAEHPLLRHLPGDADGGHRDGPPPVCGMEPTPSPGSSPRPPATRSSPSCPTRWGSPPRGAPMRLGSCPCRVTGEDTLALTGPTASRDIAERHRHRYEFNNQFRADLEAGGLALAGLSPDGRPGGDRGAPRPPLVRGRPVPPGAKKPA